MSEHLSDEQIKSYRKRELSPADLVGADDHLARCELCRRQIEAQQQLKDGLINLSADPSFPEEPPQHLTYDQLSSYTDGRLDTVEREIADVHLEICDMCAEELRDLRVFTEAMASPVALVKTHRQPRQKERFTFWHWAPEWSSVQFAGAVAALLIVAAGAWLAIRSLNRPPSQIAKSNQPRVAISPSSAAMPTPNETETQAQVQPSPVDAAKEIVVTLNDAGRQVTLDKQGTLKGLADISNVQEQMLKTALATGRLIVPGVVSEIKAKAGVLMGGSTEGVPFALNYPIGKVVKTSRPTFHWSPMAGAGAYVVSIYDHNYNPITTSPRLTETKWTSGLGLRGGQVYLWQVTALKDGKEIKSPIPPAPQARFMVADQVKVNELARMKRTHPDSHLLLGTLYAQAGLLDEAEEELQKLAAANPQSSLAHKLLHSVRAAK